MCRPIHLSICLLAGSRNICGAKGGAGCRRFNGKERPLSSPQRLKIIVTLRKKMPPSSDLSLPIVARSHRRAERATRVGQDCILAPSNHRPAVCMAGMGPAMVFKSKCALQRLVLKEYRRARTCRRIGRRGTRGGNPSSDRNWSGSGPRYCGAFHSRNCPTLPRCYKGSLRSLPMQKAG